MDGRLKVCFRTLNEREENEISSAIIDYLIWYKVNQEEVHTYISKIEKNVGCTTIVDFWIENIGKNHKIESFLQSVEVIADTYEFVETYQTKLNTLVTVPQMSIFFKKWYRTEEHSEQLKVLLPELKSHPDIKKVIKYMEQHRLDENHITYDYAERIIKKCTDIKDLLQ